MSVRQGVVVLMAVCAVCTSSAVALSPERRDTVNSPTHVTLSAGMGVSYLSPADLVDLVNASTITGERQSEFKAAVVFFGSAHLPLSPDWAMKLD